MKLFRYCQVLLTTLALVISGVGLAVAAPFLFSANPSDRTVTQIDINTGQITVVMDATSGLTQPTELAIDSFGNLYVANGGGGVNILRLSTGGQVSTFVTGQGVLDNISGLAFGPQGNLFIANFTGSIFSFDSSSSALALFGETTSVNPFFDRITDIEFDNVGNLYVGVNLSPFGDTGNIVKFDPQGNASVFGTAFSNTTV